MTNEYFEQYLKKNFPHTSSFGSGLIMGIFDALALFLSIGFSFFLVNLFDGPNHTINFRSFFYYAVYIPPIILVFLGMGMYPGIMVSPAEEVKKFFLSCFFCFAGITFMVLIPDFSNWDYTREHLITYSSEIQLSIALILAIPISTIALPAMREITRHFFGRFKFWGVPCVIYCDGDSADTIITRLKKNRSFGYHPAVIINNQLDENESFYKGIPAFKPSSEIEKIIHKKNIKVAVLCDYHEDLTEIMTSYRYTIQVKKNPGTSSSTQHIKDIAGIIGFSSTHNLTFKFNLFIKRILDLFLILLVSPVVLPAFIIVGFLVKVTSKGPIFYGHKRAGKNGKEFKCWKFRTMGIDSQERLAEILATDPVRRAEWEKDRKFTDDPRVTKFGKFLRKTSLDELPQLVNIFTGEMSLVGPRPVTYGELDKYGDSKDFVLSVTPGLTGMWQVSGRSDTGYEERITFDSYYIQNWSIWLDIWILIKTVWVVLKGKGAY
ncbi:MAG: undecaprenyl-phosphate galactose phosphotransferase WbaP [Treponema sp.]|nr:undecaprenyl-phosphate galactose phosphotransferase WbaP [Treponema sp.]